MTYLNKTKISAFLLASSILGWPVLAVADDLTIGLDFSDSYALITDKHYAAEVAKNAADEIAKMSKGDVLRIQAFGTYGVSSLKIEKKLNFGYPPKKAAIEVRTVIEQIPEMFANGRFEPQQQTGIVAFVSENAGRMKCGAKSGRLIAYTDGVEWTSQTDGQKLADGKAKLPVYGTGFQKCSLQIRGIGYFAGTGSDYVIVHNLTNAWNAWTAQVGFNKDSSVSSSL